MGRATKAEWGARQMVGGRRDTLAAEELTSIAWDGKRRDLTCA